MHLNQMSTALISIIQDDVARRSVQERSEDPLTLAGLIPTNRG